MGNQYFQFKQFKIEQEKAAMKVGVDSVILGAWVQLNHIERVLDVGTGTGLLALMIAQRNPECIIDAIDIERDAIEQAKYNFSQSPWKNRLNLIEQSFQGLTNEVQYDLIISNPPYFEAGKSVLSNKVQRAIARQDQTLNQAELIHGVKNRLSKNGILALILPYGEICNQFKKKARDCGLFCNRSLLITPVYGKQINRIVMEFSFNEVHEEIHELSVYQSHGIRSEAYRELTKEFYL